MESDCPPAKRRKKLLENQVNRAESNNDPNPPLPNETINTTLACLDEPHSTACPTDILNSEVLVEQDDHVDLEQENYKSKNHGENGHSHSRKKLLVLDVNGLLVDIVADPDESFKPDTIIGSKAVFKRPFCDDFLKFCFERFNVGVWTSRTRRNIERVLDFLMKDVQHQLLFCWDQSHCTETGFNTIENSGKPLVLKELKKLWEKQDPSLPWDRGAYDESNTLFLDDSPYKALRNPPHTAIFPYSYSYRNTKDNDLGPEGDLRNYLEKLAASDNVQKFIKENPFGQQPITYDNESWSFYRKIIGPSQPLAGPSRSRKKLIIIDASGLLVDISTVPREGYRPDTMQGSRAVFKRPYCDEFLNFCFKRFNVGFWTSASRYHMERELDYLMRETQHKLLFCWDRTHCTDTGFNTVENNCKTLFLKELRKLWEKQDPNLPWEIGEYDESNTLLLDNAPCKALLNPPHTAIFPYSYRYWMTEDNSLGPKGDLRIYLERLAACENVQKFVSENPFGQRPIREKNLSWGFYQKVIRAFSAKWKHGTNGSMDAQCQSKNLSEPKADTTTASVSQTLSVSKTDTTNVSAAPTLLEPTADSTTASAAPILLEPKPDSTTALTAPTLLEPEADRTASAAQILMEPTADSTTSSTVQTLLEPRADTSTSLTAQTLLEPEKETIAALVGQTLSEPEIDTAIVSDDATLLEPVTDSATVSAASTSLEPETKTSSVAAAPTLLEPEIDTATVLAAPTLLKPKTDTAVVLERETNTATISCAPTLLEPKTDTATASGPETNTAVVSAAPNILEPEIDTITMSDAPTVLEPETDTSTVSAAPTLTEPETSAASVSAAPTLLEPETRTTTFSGSQPSPEAESHTTGSHAQTLTKLSVANNNPSLEPVNNGS